jgi:hypothetical protein
MPLPPGALGTRLFLVTSGKSQIAPREPADNAHRNADIRAMPLSRGDVAHDQATFNGGRDSTIGGISPDAMRPSDVMALQRLAGNNAVGRLLSQKAPARPSVQRWTNPVITLKGKQELINDAVNGDVTAINQLSESDYVSATDAQRFKMIDHLNAQGNGRWGRDVWSLEQLWSAFGTRLPQAVGSDLKRWDTSLAIDSDLTNSIPYTHAMRDKFPTEVNEVVTNFLFSNREFVAAEMKSLNFPPNAGASLNAPTAAETDQIQEAKMCAAAIARIQRAQEEVREKVYVGYDLMRVPAATMPVQGAPMMGSPFVTYTPVKFDPTAAPQYDKAPGATGLLEQVLPSPAKLQAYDAVKEKYDTATGKVRVLMDLHPELYAVIREGKSSATADFAAKDARAARQVLAQQMQLLYQDIEKTQIALDGGKLNVLDLTPVHARLMEGFTGPGVKSDWTTPLAKSVIKSLVADHEFSEALKQLGMQLAAQALFMFAPLAGEGALVLMLAGLVVTAGKAQMSADRFEALQAAAKSAPQEGTELVPIGEVERAKAIRDADEFALILAAVAVAAAVAGEIIGAIRAGPAETPENIGTRLAAESKGQPSRFDYITTKINAAKLSQADAATAASTATRGIGLRLFNQQVGDDIVLCSVMPGSGKPVLIVTPEGAIVRGTADIVIAQPPSLEHPMVVTNVKPNTP